MSPRVAKKKRSSDRRAVAGAADVPDGRFARFRVVGPVVLVVVAGLCWLWWSMSSAEPLSGRGRDFNVLLITLDTTRADHLGCYGHPAIKTPNIDALARQGVRFTQCTSAAPITLPSHASMMTATFPFVHRARHNGRYLADEGNVTLAELLKAAGYSTGAEVGAFVLDAVWGIDQGFDSYRSGLEPTEEESRFERLASQQSVTADNVCDRALEWLGQHGSERFFLWAHFFDPHQPWRPPERFAAPYADARFGAYWGEIAFVDEQVGRLLGELRRMGLEDRTLVVLTADHGEGLLQHGELSHTYYVYDTTLLAPLIFRCPQRMPEKRVIDAQVRTVDIAPTVLAFLGLSANQDAQGQSLLPLLEGETDDPHLFAYGESVSAHDSFGYARLRTCRADGWKYIHAPTPELYDIGNDPGEEVNLADRYPEHVESMREQLEALIAESMVSGGDLSRVAQLDSVAAEQLRALGYVGGYTPTDTQDELQLFQNWEGPDPKDHIVPYNQYLKARGWANAGNQEQAVAILRELVTEEPSNPAFRDLLAGQLRETGSLDESVAQYETLLDLQPDNALAHYRLGKVLGELDRLEKSVEHLRRAVEVMPEDPNVHSFLALALLRLGDSATAERHFRLVLELDPMHQGACTELSTLLRLRGRWVEAVGVLRDGLGRRPNSTTIANNLAWFLATASVPEARDGAEAVRLAERLRRQMQEDNPAVLDTLAAAYAEAGRFDEAVATVRQALQLAESSGLADIAEEIRARLLLYESGSAYHESP